MPRVISREFHSKFKESLVASNILHVAVEEHTRVSRRTVYRWTINTLPKNYLNLLEVLAFIRLGEKETNQLLHMAGFPPLAELRKEAILNHNQAVLQVLQAWHDSHPTPNQSLPSPNYFVGRREQILEIKKYLLKDGGLKVCGVTGLGGAGKTTLAKRLTEVVSLNEFPDGVLWGDLFQSDTESILNQFAHDYGEDLTQYSDVAAKASLVRSLLSHKRALIVLDGAENDGQLKYLIPPKISECAVLITSRKKLKTLRGWESHELKGFEPKDSMALFHKFLDKTKVKLHQAALERAAEQLGQLPLAVLILASYLQFHPDEDIEQIPDVLKERQARMNLLHAEEDESVRLTFELSWEHLSEDERRRLALLSQFSGKSFSAPAAAALWNVPLREAKKWLADFVGYSLIEMGRSERWALHPLVHDYLNEKAEAHYDEQRQPATKRLVEHFTNNIQQSGTAGNRHLMPDLDNIIHALGNSYTYQLWELLARNAPPALNLLETFGRYEAIDHLADKALVAAERLEDDAALATLLYCLATIDSDGYMNDARAVERANLGRTIARDNGDWTLVCEFTFILAQAAWTAGDADLEQHHWAEIERIAKPRQLDDILLRLTEARAWRAVWHGDYDFAETTLTTFIQYARRAQKTRLLWRSYDYLAYVFHRKGDFKRADANYRRALDVAVKADGLRPITVLLGRAQNAIHWGHLDLAQTYAAEALTLSKTIARPRDILDAYIYGGDVAQARSDYPAARQLWEQALEISQASHARAKECVTLARLGGLCIQQGNLSEAGSFLERALHIAVRFRETSIRGFIYEQLAYLSAAQGEIQQAHAYGEKCLEIYDRRRLREAVVFRKWLLTLPQAS